MVSRPVGSSIDFPPDDGPDSGREVDPSAYALGAIFGSVALPDGMPDYLKAAILDRADQARDAAGDFIIDNRMNPVDARARQAKTDADDDDNISQMAQIVRQERQEREREEWSRTASTVAGVTMTGAEWSQFAERLRSDDDLRRRLAERFEREGATPEEARIRIDRVTQAAEAASIPPDQRTPVQKQLLGDAQVDADVRTAREFRDTKARPAAGLTGTFDAAASGATEPISPTPSVAPARAIVPTPGYGF